MTGSYDAYRAYMEGAAVGSSPVGLVIALYEGAIDASRRARQCLESGDALERSKYVTKAFGILTELILSLDHEKGGEVSVNLKRLYSYMQCKVLEAHAEKNQAPLQEVEKLLTTLLDAWQTAAKTEQLQAQAASQAIAAEHRSATREDEDSSYGDYFVDTPGSRSETAVTC